jgi:hypothetical protein
LRKIRGSLAWSYRQAILFYRVPVLLIEVWLSGLKIRERLIEMDVVVKQIAPRYCMCSGLPCVALASSGQPLSMMPLQSSLCEHRQF